MAKWYNGGGADNDVVLFSKVRLARNLNDTPFKNRMSREIKKNTVKKLYASVKNSDIAGDFNIIDLSVLSPVKAVSYAEKQLISTDFAKEQGTFLLSADESSSIMLCGEDHIRIHVFSGGFSTEQAYSIADKIDNVFIHNLPIAFDERLGFLTASPINLGTGLKVSVALHLPAIQANGGISRLASMVGKLGLSLRSLYSEKGAFYLLSNQISMGITEKAAIDNINAVASQIIRQERNLRDVMKNSEAWEDKLYRSMGTLKMARRLDFGEFIELISDVRLGISLGFFDEDMFNADYLIHNLADGTVLSDNESEDTPEISSKIRAEIIRKKLK
ncbi:MAG: ATP--guanido phosphotransferase [Eubacterium sp.]|nr:ATP--guanido phosphotransferase [Eubacterium sp.]